MAIMNVLFDLDCAALAYILTKMTSNAFLFVDDQFGYCQIKYVFGTEIETSLTQCAAIFTDFHLIITWEQAYKEIAEKLNEIIKEH